MVPNDADRSTPASFWQTMKAVMWSFFGVRRRRDLDADSARLNPVHLVIAALLATAIFVTVLILIVWTVVK